MEICDNCERKRDEGPYESLPWLRIGMEGGNFRMTGEDPSEGLDRALICSLPCLAEASQHAADKREERQRARKERQRARKERER